MQYNTHLGAVTVIDRSSVSRPVAIARRQEQEPGGII
jgi:hypothetical protein